jgi:hypothetical protein
MKNKNQILLTISIAMLIPLQVYTQASKFPNSYPVSNNGNSINTLINENILIANPINNGNFNGFSFNTSGDCSANTVDGTTSERAPFQASGTPCESTWGSWWVSHGTPEIYRVGLGIFANNQAVLWSGKWNSLSGDNNIYGEGIFLNCFYFNQNQTYNISFDVRSTGPAFTNVYVDLVSNLPSQREITYIVGDTYIIPQPLENQNIWQFPNFNKPQFYHVDVSFIPTKQWQLLWIHPISSASQSNYSDNIPKFYVDNVSINNFPLSIVYNNSGSSLPNQTIRCDYIETLNSVQVISGQDISFLAGNRVTLKPGFQVLSGGRFTAGIYSCGLVDACATGNTKKSEVVKESMNYTNKNEVVDIVQVYPNPNKSGLFNLRFSSSRMKNSILSVYNIKGELILNDIIISEEQIIDLSKQTEGVYFLRIIGETNFIEKIIKL